MTKETGIIMSGSHPVDILEYRKDMTRRTWGLKEINLHPDAWEHFGFDQAGRFSFRWKGGDRILNVRCPYGGVGDRLRIKETYLVDYHGFHSYLADYYTPHPLVTPEAMLDGIDKGMYWKKPSIFMKWEYSRILAEITELRVEQVQQITETEAVREGCKAHHRHIVFGVIPAFDNQMVWVSATQEFRELWDSLNKKRGYGWERNPWVWPIGLKLLSHSN